MYSVPGYLADPNNLPKYHNQPQSWSEVYTNFTANQVNVRKVVQQMKNDSNVNLAILYIPIPDGFGHQYGKNSPEVITT